MINVLSLQIKDVRTKDDALITVKVMIFFELKDIDLMVNVLASIKPL